MNWIKGIGKLSLVGLAIISILSENVCYADDLEIDLDLGDDDMLLTGTRIQALNEGPNPIIVITEGDIIEQGYASVYDALRSVTMATGSHQAEQIHPILTYGPTTLLEPPPIHQGRYGATPSAMELNLRGFGTSRTLVLINGGRVADAPEAFNYQDTFFNFATIPISAVKRIEILTGGASAIYGSDAVAGVINIILKDSYQDVTISTRIGTTTLGGGESVNSKLVGGFNWRSGSVVAAIEYDKRNPIYGSERPWLDSINDGPNAGDPIVDIELTDLSFLSYAPPNGQETCAQFDDLVLLEADGFGGYACGRNKIGDLTIRADRERYSGFFHVDADIGKSSSFFGDFLVWRSRSEVRGERLSSRDLLVPVDGSELSIYTRTFGPSETGDQDINFNESFWLGVAGFAGTFSNDIDYQVAFRGSQSNQSRTQLQLKSAESYEYFFEDYNRLWEVTPPEIIAEIVGTSETDGQSQSLGVTGQLTSSLGTLNDLPIWFSVGAEYYRSSYLLEADARTARLNTDELIAPAWENFVGTTGEGVRNHGALMFESLTPLINSDWFGLLEMQLAARYDFYNDEKMDDGWAQNQEGYENQFGSPTVKLGLSWRPMEELLFRSTFATSFKAPGMHNLYADGIPEVIFVFDVYDCRMNLQDTNGDGVIDTPLDNFSLSRSCGNYTEASTGYVSGSSKLKEEEGVSGSFGLVYSPFTDVSLSLDFYHIEIENVVNGQQSFQDVFFLEADCRLGEDVEGRSVDTNSEACLQAISQVEREGNPFGEISPIFGDDVSRAISIPFQTALLTQSGVDFSAIWHHQTPIGEVGLKYYYTHLFSFNQKDTAEDQELDLLRGVRANTLRSKNKLVGTWNWEQWSSAITLVHQGKVLPYSRNENRSQDRVDSWLTTNLYFGYTFFENTTLGFTVNNLTNEVPPVDKTYDEYPHYERGHFNSIGREIFLEFAQRF